jgi:hypothetical protein
MENEVGSLLSHERGSLISFRHKLVPKVLDYHVSGDPMTDSETIRPHPAAGILDGWMGPEDADSPYSIFGGSLDKCPFPSFEVNLFQSVVRFRAGNRTCNGDRNRSDVPNGWIEVSALSTKELLLFWRFGSQHRTESG